MMSYDLGLSAQTFDSFYFSLETLNRFHLFLNALDSFDLSKHADSSGRTSSPIHRLGCQRHNFLLVNAKWHLILLRVSTLQHKEASACYS